MKKFLIGMALVVATNAFAATKAVGPAGASTQTANHATANEPSADSDGLSLDSTCGLRVIVSAASGQTLSGAGTLKFWYWSPSDGWVENLTTTVSVTSTTRRQVTVDFEVLAKLGRVYVEADTVTVSGGSLTVRIETHQCRN